MNLRALGRRMAALVAVAALLGLVISLPSRPASAVTRHRVATTSGYWMVAADGGVFSFGNAAFYGSTGGIHLNAPVVGMAPTPSSNGYWLVTADGGIFAFGGATFYGSMGGHPLNSPVVGMATTADGRGYWLVAADGGVFSFGDAGFYGSAGGIKLNRPIVGIAADGASNGYWLVASDGGIFSFGDAPFYGSMGGSHLNRPVVGMASLSAGNGYRFVAADGGIFTFGDAAFYGSTGSISLNKPVVGMADDAQGNGYWLAASDGGVFSFGGAPFDGSMGGTPLNKPIVAVASTQAPFIDHPCSRIPQTNAIYNFPVPAADPTPVDPLATVSAAGGGSFVDTVTNQPFVPRGAHYVRLATVRLGPRYTICMNANFDVGSGLDAYDPHRAAQALSQMNSYGYNVVYVGLNSDEIGNTTGPGLNANYVANLASFINIARSYDIRVLIALMPLPFHGGYLPDQAAYTTKGSAKYHNLNLYYIDANYLAAQKRYVSDLITGLTGAGANMSDIFSLELTGEVVFNRNQWPLNMTSGLVQTDGQIQPYDMSDPSSRNDLIDQNTLNWENQLTEAIHTQLPSVLVSVGYFTPYALVRFPQTPRISRPQSSFSSESDVNFVDIHMYPIFGPIVDQINSLGVSPPTITKPVILGEFGEYTSEAPTPAAAAQALTAWQQQTCDIQGLAFTGWITWTWDTEPSEQFGLYNMVDGNDAIASALSPRLRPNPCQ